MPQKWRFANEAALQRESRVSSCVDRAWPGSTSIIANDDRSKRESNGRERDRLDRDIAEFQAAAAGVGGAARALGRGWLGLAGRGRRRGFRRRSRRHLRRVVERSRKRPGLRASLFSRRRLLLGLVAQPSPA